MTSYTCKHTYDNYELDNTLTLSTLHVECTNAIGVGGSQPRNTPDTCPYCGKPTEEVVNE